MPIYQPDQKALQNIIEWAEKGILMIPDIQREYVWTPSQIVRLIDSLLRGWPYSTLLLWDTGLSNNHRDLVPHHPFRLKISRVPPTAPEQPKEASLPNANFPGSITMALDGQQRLQSLLLAFGGHEAGMYLLDKEWWRDKSEDGEHPYRGREVNNRWMFGQLYLDLEALADNVTKYQMGGYVLKADIDYIQLFKWACPAEAWIGGPRPNQYEWPIQKLWEINKGNGRNRYIHASHLWRNSEGFQHLNDVLKLDKVEELLKSQYADEWDEEGHNKVACGLVGLLGVLSRVREQQISFLRLHKATETGYPNADTYSEAIVTIFTRLNAAGRALEEEEITFAWVKNRWNPLLQANPLPNRKNGADIADELVLRFLKAAKLKEAQIIRLLSHVWVTFAKTEDFRLLSAKDLLNGRKIQTMAEWLYSNWDDVCQAVSDVSDSLVKLQFMYPYHFHSVNVIYALIIYRIGIRQLLPRGGAIHGEYDRIQQEFESDLLKWLGLTIFGGKWAKKSDEDMASFVKIMGEKWLTLGQSKDLQQWRQAFISYVDMETRKKAQIFVNGFGVDNASYSYTKARPVLALWNHCDTNRKAYCNRLSILNQKDVISHEFRSTIDHIVPQRLWEKNIDESSDYREYVHQLGNLMELDASDNPAKNNRTLAEWLKDKQGALNDLSRHFGIDDVLSTGLMNPPENVSCIIDAIKQRTVRITKDVDTFLQSLGEQTQS